MVDGLGGINVNSWEKGRCTYSGDFVFYIENQATDTYCYDNSWHKINFEVCNGGGIKVLGGHNITIDDVISYDLVGPTTRDFIYLGASTHVTPIRTRHFTIKDAHRRGGTLGGGLSDIKLASNGADTGLIIGGDNATLGGYTVDISGNFGVTIISPRSGWTISNEAQTTTIIGYGTTLNHRKGSTETIVGDGTPEGAVTANPGSLFQRRDGGAGTGLYVKESGTGNTGWVAK
jgi:hypothetical protein